MDRKTAKELVSAHFQSYLERKGIQVNKRFLCLNPEHFDHTPSMVYSSRRNKCHCFACGVDVDIFDVIGWDYNTSDFNAELEIGCDLFGISLTEAPSQKQKEILKEGIKQSQKNQRREPFTEEELERFHAVYCAMQSVSPLSEHDWEYLRKTRHLTDNRIKKDYFRLVTNKTGREHVIRKIRKITGLTDAELATVPGFFIDKYTGTLDYVGDSIHKVDPNGIGILIRNVDGLAVGIQIRRDTKQKGNRYVWFSSSFMKDGRSPGAAKDILIPKYPKTCLCMTEGRFKSEILAEEGNITISLQGVSSWKGVENDIKILQERYDLTSLYLFFDSDILGNRQLFLAIRDMVNMLQKEIHGLQIRVALWPIASGKGIDDCIAAGNRNKVQFLPVSTFMADCETIFQKVLDANDFKGHKLNKLPSEKQRQLKTSLQEQEEAWFFHTKEAKAV